MNTPSADIMSSPDPLNETVQQSAVPASIPPPSTRRVVRSSQRSSRFSMGTGTSPRKQTFELEVGDNKAPQRLLVTVETEEPSVTAGPSSARRKLFQDSPYLPASRRREMATTTTVPLKGAIDEQVDDPNATPRRRGRPRKTNGTPLPGAGTKRKSGTPISGTPRRRQRTEKDTDITDKITQNNAQPTPGTRKRGRPRKNPSVELASNLGKELDQEFALTTDNLQEQTFAPDEIAAIDDTTNLPVLRADDSQADNDVTLIFTPSEAEANLLRANRTTNNSAPVQQSEPDSDIWMATLDDEPTPRPASRATQAAPAPPSPGHEAIEDSSDFGDYGYGPAGSDASSADEPQSDVRPGTEDTAAGEDFSMIFMDSLPSLQASLRSSVREITENDIGEETSMIINNTLESLRQSLQDRDRPNTNQETAEKLGRTQESKQDKTVEPREELKQSTIRPPLTFSPNRNLSSRWLQSPRRIGSSPLRHQVLKSNARENPEASEYRGSPLASQRQDSSHLENEESNLYDDSFSEIPDKVLEAATPRRPQAAAENLSLEENDVEMEDTQLIQLEEEPEETEQHEDQQVLEEEHEAREEEAEAGPLASNVSAVSRSEAGRLPTPDDTPPNIEVGSDNLQKSTDVLQNPAMPTSSRGSSLMNSSPKPVNKAQVLPRVIEEPTETVDDESAGEDHELMMDEMIDPPQEADDHSDVEDHVLEETLIEHLDEEENVGGDEEENEEENEEEIKEAEVLPEIVLPQKARLSLETETQQPEVTPLNQLTSPIQEHLTLPEMVSERASRPTLSPIVRAGRALQSVTSDPPSPEARDHHLRSPFRRSATRELGPRETQSNQRTSASPGKPRSFPDAGQISQGNSMYDDPFGTQTRHTGQSSFMEALERSSGGSSPRHRRTASRDSAASSLRFQAPSEGGMSWVDNEGPINDNLRGDVPLEAFERSKARPAISPSVSHGQIDGAIDDADDETEDAGDDMDLWEFEAERSIVQPVQKPSAERKPQSPIHKRSNIPSPWRRQVAKDAQRAASIEHQTRSEIDEIEEVEGPIEAKTASQTEPMEITHEETSQAEGHSLVTQKEAPEATKAPTSAKAARFDLSTFFSSPAAFPGLLADKLSPLKMSVFRAQRVEPEPVEMEHTMPTSSMFPQVPQQELLPRAQPRFGLFSPIRRSQPAVRQEVSEESEQESHSQSDSRSNMSSSSRRSEASLRQEEHNVPLQEMSEQQQEGEQQEDTEEEEPEEPEELEGAQPAESLPSVPQKMNFTPQRQRPRQSFFKTSTQAAAPAPAPEAAPVQATTEPTPPRMQLSHADIHKWQQQTSNASDDSPERPPARPILRPLPPKNASPYKSSLRSPLKPHTPGRVVEFTSSVLSPVEQAKVRHQRRLSNSSAASQSSGGIQRPRLRPPPRHVANKENNTLLEPPVAKAGLPIKQPRPEHLSQTVWTRKHWLLLDDLLQQRRQGPFRLNFERYSDQFLGKMVTSHGEAMTLERWHLECVDAFKAQVGGWDEAALAKRLFALILGEQRRNQEVAEKPVRVMFH
ncbi:hypothetical protein FHETE_1025 [Fusarium heterosporum]|uniref:Uncharacterized protein n=1 Tax=Fusarium heterosporum TaxID=42747 RepID=A0A8H5X0K0_FUSHE|nr:hypothetical protein FHETE_1025 [Fusarium heterosporum]